jgi:XTP/dITP diphosphohydrolase
VTASTTLLVATRTTGKLRELVAMFSLAGLAVRDLSAAGLHEDGDEEGIESFSTFEENALAKARHFHRRSGGQPTVADDSGLEVVALGGAPGVRSRRFAQPLEGVHQDDANNAALLAALEGQADRRARFVCAVAYVDGAREIVVRGRTTGVITDRVRGVGGFGYDPLFLSDDLGATFAEASREAKADISHRGRAFAALVAALRTAGIASDGTGTRERDGPVEPAPAGR